MDQMIRYLEQFLLVLNNAPIQYVYMALCGVAITVLVGWIIFRKRQPTARTFLQSPPEIKGLRTFLAEQSLPMTDALEWMLEDELVARDIRPNTAKRLAQNVRKYCENRQHTSGLLMEALVKEFEHLLENSNEFKHNQALTQSSEFDWLRAGETNVLMLYGVNGAGKTSTLAKLATRYLQKDLSVMFVAGDTFRAGAIEQIQYWSDMLKIPLIKQDYGANPTALLRDALNSAQSKSIDVLMVDTSGRMDNRNDLLEQLLKMQRTVEQSSLNLRSYLVLDGTAGKSSLNQVEKYSNMLELSGLIITKLDTLASGGSLLESPKKIPIRYLTKGEKLTDLVEYTPTKLIEYILG